MMIMQCTFMLFYRQITK